MCRWGKQYLVYTLRSYQGIPIPVMPLSKLLSLTRSNLIAMMHNRPNVNGAAIQIVRVVYPVMVDIRCVSHTLDLVGDKFQAPTHEICSLHYGFLYFHVVQRQKLTGKSRRAKYGILHYYSLVESMGIVQSSSAKVWRCCVISRKP